MAKSRLAAAIAALPQEWRDQHQQERRQARQAAAAFAAVCSRGDAAMLYNANLWLNECVDAWRPAMAKVARLSAVSRDIQSILTDLD